MFNSLWLHGLYPTTLIHRILQARILEWIAISFSNYLIIQQSHYWADTWENNNIKRHMYLNVQFRSLSHVWLFLTPWTAACQASLSITNSQSLLKLMSIVLVMPSTYLILCCPFSCLQSSPALESFPMFTEALLSIARIWKQSKCPLTDERIKIWYIYTMELQPKMEKFYNTQQNKTRSCLWLRSWTPYCQIQA